METRDAEVTEAETTRDAEGVTTAETRTIADATCPLTSGGDQHAVTKSDFSSDSGWKVLEDRGHCTNNDEKSCVEYTKAAVEYSSNGAVITTQLKTGSRRRSSKCKVAKQTSANFRWGQPSFYGTT